MDARFCLFRIGGLLLLTLGVAGHEAVQAAPPAAVPDTLRITEFMAVNRQTLADEEGDYSDWVEIHNAGSAPVSLRGWSLTDDPDQPTRWTFPDVTLPGGGYQVVFASGKNRGTTVAAWETVVAQGDVGRYQPGTTAPPANWAAPDFDDTAWATGPSGYGYGDGDDATEITPPLPSVFVRLPFNVGRASDVRTALLHLDYDDAFVAYLNGVEVARSSNLGTPGIVPAYDQGAGSDHEARLYQGLPPETFALDHALPLLVDGENVLAVEVHNISVSSSDLTLIPFLTLGLAAPPDHPRGVAAPIAPLLATTPLHTNFSLDADGEYLALVMPDGKTVASAFAPAYPPQSADLSYGLGNGGNGYFAVPTPGAPNGPVLTGRLEPPVFSVPPGFFDAPFKLTLSSTTPGTTIRYTTDGSTPTPNSFRYSEPLAIAQTTIVRAAAFKDGFLPSEVATRTYLFLEDVVTQSASGAPPPGWPSQWGNNVVDYGMDPQVVGPPGSGTRTAVVNALAAIPSISLVTDLPHLFDANTGIYANAFQHGVEWERPTSVELLFPDGTEGFQINAGLRIRGGYSRDPSNPKHAFRLFFESPKLHYPLFGDEGPETFENLDLRTSQNFSWSFDNSDRNIMNRDVFSRDLQRALGEPYTRSRYYHLYLNGQYWGLYQSQERSEAAYGAQYFGGTAEEYDVLKSTGTYNGFWDLEATDGNLDAWRQLWDLCNTIADTPDEAQRRALYLQAQGLDPDGRRNPAFPVLLDVDNLIHYLLVIFYTGNQDAPVTLDKRNVNNFYGVRNRQGDAGFVFFAHDSEWTLLDVNDNVTGPFPAGHTFIESNPQWLHQQLMHVENYRLRFADLVHRHFGPGGVFTPERTSALFQQRAAEIEQAIVAESARWGDAQREPPFTKLDWQNHINFLLNTYFPARSAVVLNQLRNTRRFVTWRSPEQSTTQTTPLYPNVSPPTFNQAGGTVAEGFRLQLSGPDGMVYYTLDGSDPRALDGSPAPTAQVYDGQPIALTRRTTVQARVLDGGTWSAMEAATFLVNATLPTASNLAITELHYNPPAPEADEVAAGFDNNDDFEFIELLNRDATTPLDLSGLTFTDGITATLGAVTLAPGARTVLVNNAAAFAHRYGTGIPVAGVYEGRLSNNGETLTLLAAPGGGVLHAFTYGTSGDWPERADGHGSSLEVRDPDADLNDPDNWRSSAEYHGTPGTADTGPQEGVRINEVLSHTDPPLLDAIELFNPTASPVDLSGWYLSDSYTYRKFALPAGTVLPAGGYRVFDEQDFNAQSDTTDFALDSVRGDALWLVQADAAGNLTRFIDHVTFGAAENGVSFGRWPNGTGDLYPMTTPTLGAANSGPRLGTVLLREVMYHPVNDDANLEYVEVYNAGSEAVSLTRWRLADGVTFDFPEGYTLNPGASVLVVPFDPVAAPDRATVFLEAYPVFGGLPLLGPWTGRLDNGGERLTLTRPDTPPAAEPDFYPALLAFQVSYDDDAPWPDADGNGAALYLSDPAAFPQDAAAWVAIDRRQVAVEPPVEVTHFALSPVFPNPTRGLATLELVLEEPERVTITVYDLLGREVLRLYEGTPEPRQTHRFQLNGSGLSSGLYFIRVGGSTFQATRAVAVVR